MSKRTASDPFGVADKLNPPERFVYFVLAPVSDLVKVGVATDVQKRFSALQCGSAERLTFMGAIPGTQNHEAIIHSLIGGRRKRGEWFEKGPWCVRVINSIERGDSIEKLIKKLEAHQE